MERHLMRFASSWKIAEPVQESLARMGEGSADAAAAKVRERAQFGIKSRSFEHH